MSHLTLQQVLDMRKEWVYIRKVVADEKELATEKASNMVRRLSTLRSSQSEEGQRRMKDIVFNLRRFAPDSYYAEIIARIDNGLDYRDLTRARWAEIATY